MRLQSLALREFRNIERADLRFPEAGVVVIGENGHGKTNLLEAIAYLGTLRSARNARDRDVVRHGSAAAHMHGVIDDQAASDIRIGIDRATGRKKITLDGVEVTRQIDALGVLPSVSWSPADVALVAGGPGERRRYIDVMLALSSPRYVHALRGYRAALDRRNAALRDAARRGAAGDSVAAWEQPLAQHGAVLTQARRGWVHTNAPAFHELSAALGERDDAELTYESAAANASDPCAFLREHLARERARDLQRCITSVGPHRDDLAITLGGYETRTFGSAGQQRTAAIALRLLEGRTLRTDAGGHPVLLLDDPFAELDATRAARALALLEGEHIGQVVLAVPRATDIPHDFEGLDRWNVQDGVFSA